MLFKGFHLRGISKGSVSARRGVSAFRVTSQVLAALCGMEVLLFTRYPVPGKVKSRLIPALGAEGAEGLHRWMVERTVAQITQPAPDRRWRGRVCFTGGSEQSMAEWLGATLPFEEQAEGDLGQRLLFGMRASRARGHERVVVIGTDCPGLTTEVIDQAFSALDRQPMVVGPAHDGGYYLLGLRGAPEAALFTGIDWGQGTVLAQTLRQASVAGLGWELLPEMQDVDFPEDVKEARRFGWRA